MNEAPLLDPSLLPGTLYDSSEGVLSLPPSLLEAYFAVLDKHGLLELARKREANSSPVGGLSAEQSAAHFAQAFDGSAARALLAVLDPQRQVTPIANAFLVALSGNRLCIVDVPAGAGAASLTFLACIAELREKSVLPRMPLEVELIGGEPSEFAKAYATAMNSGLKDHLARQAIYVTATFAHWDVLDDLVNADFIGQVRDRSSHPCKRLLVVANFNAFLEREKKRKKAMPQISELFRHLSGAGHVAIWLEPHMNTAIAPGGLLPGVVLIAKAGWKRFVSIVTNTATLEDIWCAESLFAPALDSSRRATVRLAVLRLDLGRQ